MRRKMDQKKRTAAYLQVTRKCNNKCIFCSNPQFEQESSLDDLKKEVLKFNSEGITEILLSGGEPTISENLSSLIRFIKENRLNVRMISNGVELSNKSLVKELKGAGLKDINISIHHYKEDIADSMAQKKGHWRKTIKGIENALAAGMTININTTINSQNAKCLYEFISFLIRRFPGVKHYVFNNLDPGNADGVNKSRAGEHPEIIARLVNFELGLAKAARLLKQNNKTFRIERVPLCYMRGFEEFSTETRKIVKNETYTCAFLRPDKGYDVRTVPPNIRRVKSECCSQCRLNSICAGLQKEYAQIHGIDELSPSFDKAENIKKKIV